MTISSEEFESWCYRNGGETYEESPSGPGIVCRFPDIEAVDRVAYLPDVDAFQVITHGQFYATQTLQQQTESRIDDADRLQIETEDTRTVVDPG